MLSSMLIAGVLLAANPTTQHVPGTRIALAVEQALKQQLERDGSTAALSVGARIGDQVVPAGDLAIEPGAIAGAWPRRRAGVPVRLLVDGHAVRTLTVWVEATDLRPVLTYASDYSPSRTGSDVRLETAVVDMTCCSGTVVTSVSQIEGLRSKRAVRAGEPVMLADFEPLPDIVRQQRVDIEVSNGPVRLIARGMALADGRIGERIAVRAEQSQAVLQGRIASKDKVVVNE